MDMIAEVISREKRDDREDYPGKMGEAVAYRLTPPLKSTDWDNDKDREDRYIWVSQINVNSMWETYIFPADKNGKVTDWLELEGSRKGYITPDSLMRELGYTVVMTPRPH